MGGMKFLMEGGGGEGWAEGKSREDLALPFSIFEVLRKV